MYVMCSDVRFMWSYHKLVYPCVSAVTHHSCSDSNKCIANNYLVELVLLDL